MLRIDAHQHFWVFDPVRDSWITDDMSRIQRNFLPADLEHTLKQNGMDGCVAVQADQTEEQNEFLLHLTEGNDFIKGVVGWVDLRAADIEERLQQHSHTKLLKGFRHVLQGEANRALMLEPDFRQGISLLNKYGFTYDILIFPDQLKYAEKLVKAFPDQKFVLDHIAKPYIKDSKIDSWAAEIAQLAQHQNVWCKLSGMVTEADWANWTNDTFKRYLDVVFEAFGPQRLMFGSDWPVCLVAGEYSQVKEVVSNYTAQLSPTELDAIFGGNAITFYNL
jgi:L-fuconolactonase